jgi:hypothetical protein
MILLTSTSDVVVLQAVNVGSTIDIHASYVDLGLNNAVTPTRQDSQQVGVGTRTIVPSPAANVQRNVKTLVITNEGGGAGSGDEQIIITHQDGTHTVQLIACTLKSGYTLTWSDNDGWRITDTYGALTTSPSSASSSQVGITGDGSDGFALFDGVGAVQGATLTGGSYFLNRDVFYSQVQVNSGVTAYLASSLTTGNPYRMFVNGTLTNNGTISVAGSNASGASRGIGFPNTSTPGTNGVVGIGSSGGNGTTTNGGAGTNATTAYGGGGGKGGNSPTPHTGGNGGGITAPGNATLPRSPVVAIQGFMFDTNAAVQAWTQWNGGTGGGGGAGDGTNAGGGGGGAGGVMLVSAMIVNGTGTFTAVGGNGAAGVAGNAGGGAGGGGGIAYLIYTVSFVGPTVLVSGGNGGAASGSGSPGASGNAGQLLLIQA